jgi:cytochrome P450
MNDPIFRYPIDFLTAPSSESCVVRKDFDPFAPQFLADPFAVMDSVRDTPVFYAPSIGYYVVTRYADIETVFLDEKTYSAAPNRLPVVDLVPEAANLLRAGGAMPQPSIVAIDPPGHTRLRSPTARAFTPRRVAEMEPRIRAIITRLLDAIDPAEPFDLVPALTFPLPASVVFSFLGIPEHDWPQLKQWCCDKAALTFGRPTPEQQIHHAENICDYRGYLQDFVASKRDGKDDDFTAALLAIRDENPDSLSLEEVVSILYSLTFAGHETTNYLIGNLVRRLLEKPERWEAVVGDPTLIPGAVGEVLRYDSSVPVWRRITTRPVNLGGVALPAGAKLFLWLAASGRDASVFPDPEIFDLRRTTATKTLVFGKGIHYCLGAALGKLEAQLALEALIKRFPHLRLVPGKAISFPANMCFRGPQELWVQDAGNHAELGYEMEAR